MRPSNTSKRREEIIEALAVVMAQKGYDGASIIDVATQAELTPGLVHYHFKNKLEILLALLDKVILDHNNNLDRRLTEAGRNSIEQLFTFIDFHLSLGKDANPQTLTCWIMLIAEALRQDTVSKSLGKAITSLVDRLRVILKQGILDGVFKCEPAIAASAIVATIQGYYVLGATAREAVPKGSAASAVKKMAIGILGIDPRAIEEKL